MGREPGTVRKILSHKELVARRSGARLAGARVVHCHGCFDIVHPGHVRHLKFAKSLGDILLVSITGDAEVAKGAGRPLIPQELRAENLAELDCVDWVYIEPRPTAYELLGELGPDVYVKGREYEFNDDPRFRAEREAVERSGGRVVFSSGDVIFSSTALISSMESSADPFHHRLAQLVERPDLSGAALGGVLEEIRGRRVVVVGDLITDTYVFCDRPVVAHESPVMTLRPVEHRRYDGGAAIIARHAAALGARPVLVSAAPDDDRTRELARRLGVEGVELRTVPGASSIAEKQRFLVGAQKVMKLDLVTPGVIDAGRQDQLIALAEDASAESGGCDAAIIADFGLGLLSPGVVERLCARLRPHAGVLSGDVSGRAGTLRSMRDMDLLCPSESELRDAFALQSEGLASVAWRLLDETGARAAVVTMGPEGLIAFAPLPDLAGGSDNPFRSRVRGEHVPALCAAAIDPMGCGDALLATATLALACGASHVAAPFLGAVAAGLHAQKLGNVPLSPVELRRSVERVTGARLAYAGVGGLGGVAGAMPPARQAS